VAGSVPQFLKSTVEIIAICYNRDRCGHGFLWFPGSPDLSDMRRVGPVIKSRELGYWNTLQGINISHLGKRKIIFKYAIWGGYVSSLAGRFSEEITSQLKIIVFP